MKIKKTYQFVLSVCFVVFLLAASNRTKPTQAQKMGLLVPQTKIESFIKNWTQESPWVPGYEMPASADEKQKGGVYFYNTNDLNNDGQDEVLVYIISRNFCGSGGCTLLLLQERDGVYHLISDFGVTEPSIGIFDQSKRGWKRVVLFNEISQKPNAEFFAFKEGQYQPAEKIIQDPQQVKDLHKQVSLYLLRPTLKSSAN